MGKANKNKKKNLQKVENKQVENQVENAEEVVETEEVVEDVKVEEKEEKTKADQKQKTKKAKKAKKEPKISKVKETVSELKKVNWPTFNKVVKNTLLVLGIVLLSTVGLFLVDRVLSWIYQLLVDGAVTNWLF